MKYCKPILTLMLALALLSGCGVKEPEEAPVDRTTPQDTSEESAESTDQAVPLTEEEIARVNEAFSSLRQEDGVVWASEVSCFFTSRYDKASELDLEAFLKYFPTDELVQAEDVEEFAALMALPDCPFMGAPAEDGETVTVDMLPVPVHRIREEAVNAVLAKWADITLDDIADKTGTLYLEDYHAFYTFTSDFAAGVFSCAEGEVEGGTARLWSERHGDGSRSLLTLEQRDGNWYISSFQTVAPGAE